MKLRDITGHRFGRLTAVERVPSRSGKTVYKCVCDCGQTVEAMRPNLIRGFTRSCGCLATELKRSRETTHGLSGTPEYAIWRAMRSRCKNLRDPRYGGRGIRVCERWLDFVSFYADMGPRPSPLHSLDRVDPNGNYEPGNVRWNEPKGQANNRTSNHALEWNGVKRTVSEWADVTGIAAPTIWARVSVLGWDTERALTTTVRRKTTR